MPCLSETLYDGPAGKTPVNSRALTQRGAWGTINRKTKSREEKCHTAIPLSMSEEGKGGEEGEVNQGRRVPGEE